MISYEPLWKTMKEKSATTYTLRGKQTDDGVSGSTIRRIKKNESISSNTIDLICKILNCKVQDIIEYIPDEE